MGTFFVVDGIHKGSVFAPSLSHRIVEILANYEQIFSAWEESSELRQLEKKDLTLWQTPSALFMEVLILSFELFHQTNGAFDITVGSYQWAKKQPVGMQRLHLSDDRRSFYFEIHPVHLSFDGMLKGYAVGVIARLLHEAGFSSFTIDAGGGDMAFFSEQKILFRSFSGKNHNRNHLEQHIFSPQTPSAVLKHDFASYSLEGFAAEDFLWPKLGALCDALATAGIVKADSVNIPNIGKSQGAGSR